MRAGMLAPMDIELQPLLRKLALTADGPGVWVGSAGAVDVVAMPTMIGMAAATTAARRMLERDVDHVMVVGIAGAIALDTPIGAVLAPEAVVERATGRRFEPAPLGGDTVKRRGVISCGDDLIVDRDRLAALGADGVIALDMETAAVAAVCDDAGMPWTVYRSISDRAGEGLISPELFALTKPDGSADTDAVARLLADPEQRAIMQRLAHDCDLAVEAAADAACAALALLA
jgi:adenosylhomocysteine nucleosidase